MNKDQCVAGLNECIQEDCRWFENGVCTWRDRKAQVKNSALSEPKPARDEYRTKILGVDERMVRVRSPKYGGAM